MGALDEAADEPRVGVATGAGSTALLVAGGAFAGAVSPTCASACSRRENVALESRASTAHLFKSNNCECRWCWWAAAVKHEKDAVGVNTIDDSW